MKPAILRIHSVISSALDLAVRYDWAERNVAKNASPPHPRKREPDPPTPERVARLLNLVWTEDEEFGLYLWTAVTTGARRGEVSALRENRFDFRPPASPGLRELHRQAGEPDREGAQGR
jgi:integrase